MVGSPRAYEPTNETFGNAGGSQSIVRISGASAIGEANSLAVGAAHSTDPIATIVSGSVHVLAMDEPGARNWIQCRRAIGEHSRGGGVAGVDQILRGLFEYRPTV